MVLDLVVWGVGDGVDMVWFDLLFEGSFIAARRLLREFGALEEGKFVFSDVGLIMFEFLVYLRLVCMLFFGVLCGVESV